MRPRAGRSCVPFNCGDSYAGGIPREGADHVAPLLAAEIGILSAIDRERLKSLRTSGSSARLAADQLIIIG